MAATGSTAVTEAGLCGLVRAWPICKAVGADYLITTHCQMPNGSLVRLRVRRADDGWVVSDGGAALDEALASGIARPVFGINVRRAIRSKGLVLIDGQIETRSIKESALYAGVIVVANATRDIAETLIYVGSSLDEDTLDRRTKKILVGRFHTWVQARPLIISGASDRVHKFDNTVNLPDGRRIIIDTVKHQGNSINSAIVSNLDVRRLHNDMIVQRIVFDETENWKREEIELLEVGATPVALGNLGDAVARLAA